MSAGSLDEKSDRVPIEGAAIDINLVLAEREQISRQIRGPHPE